MVYFDYDENHDGVAQGKRITVLEGLSEDEWQMVIRNAQNIPFSDGLHSLPPVHLKVGGIDLKSFGDLDPATEVQSPTDGGPSKYNWKHLRVRDGMLIGGVFVNAPLAAKAAISLAGCTDRACSHVELHDILRKDDNQNS